MRFHIFLQAEARLTHIDLTQLLEPILALYDASKRYQVKGEKVHKLDDSSRKTLS